MIHKSKCNLLQTVLKQTQKSGRYSVRCRQVLEHAVQQSTRTGQPARTLHYQVQTARIVRFRVQILAGSRNTGMAQCLR